ncbi:putative type IV conjugative transfer system coupling factor [Salinisphaera shabanensis T35B1]|uniref:DUF4400 domain-containing protein n=1 Tax=Salinisphaera TaxID=180541 RepID=UPI0033403BAE
MILKAYWVMIVVLVEILMLVLFVPSAWLDSMDAGETRMLSTLFSPASIERVEQRTADWYTTALIDTGASAAMRDYVTPREGAHTVVPEQSFNTYMQQRVDAMLMLAYTVIRRVVVTLAWLPFIALIGLPAVIDGYLCWRIKRYGFDYTSPAIHRYAWRMKGIILLGLLLVLLLPIPVPPVILPSGLAVIAISLGMAISHMPKRY